VGVQTRASSCKSVNAVGDVWPTIVSIGCSCATAAEIVTSRRSRYLTKPGAKCARPSGDAVE
jgi:hypothetical protein